MSEGISENNLPQEKLTYLYLFSSSYLQSHFISLYLSTAEVDFYVKMCKRNSLLKNVKKMKEGLK